VGAADGDGTFVERKYRAEKLTAGNGGDIALAGADKLGRVVRDGEAISDEVGTRNVAIGVI